VSPRIAVPSQFDDEQLRQLAKSPRTPSGRPLNLFATLAREPELMRRVNAMGGFFPTRGRLDGRTRELAILRTAGSLGCEYELSHHRPAGERLGLTPEEVAAAADPGIEHDWSRADGALLELVDELLARHTVTDARWSGLDGSLDDGRRLELLILVGFYAMLAGLLDAVGVELDPP
jgi:4-carboxymuconolactone decarboxylase